MTSYLETKHQVVVDKVTLVVDWVVVVQNIFLFLPELSWVSLACARAASRRRADRRTRRMAGADWPHCSTSPSAGPPGPWE